MEEQVEKYISRYIRSENGTLLVEQTSEFAWIDCYSVFGDYVGKNLNSDEIDRLALKLFTYLANWSMYSRGTFLMDYNYRTHYDAVRILVDFEYADLYGRRYFSSVGNGRGLSSDYEEYISAVMELKRELEVAYAKYKRNNDTVSEILISKVMLGALGCVPAYDTCLNYALTKLQIAPKTFSGNSLKAVLKYCEDDGKQIESCRSTLINETGIEYPDMKIIDMALWMYGRKDDSSKTDVM
ncbi:hypothetical protein [Pseudobutyrivibrio sp. YE44]|uniref:hypothetical protein n=1 Tax=Pseudobutyrivibrio sp. YE44 TaxID=1520802 RepID=UPI0011600103|nr:hypothetical protein [Pseudobutyrivibrio sp. YE44]